MAQNRMAYKPYMEAIEGLCDGLSREELQGIIIQLANEVPVGDRRMFLAKLGSLFPGRKAQQSREEKEKLQEVLFDQIDALREEIAERVENIEDGSFRDRDLYDEQDGGAYDPFFDGDPPFAGEEQVEELADLFEDAGEIFLEDDPGRARNVYRRLFDLLDEFDELASSLSDAGNTFDLKEARARYARCVYDTSDKAHRVREMIAAMDVDAPIGMHGFDMASERFPMLRDVIDAGTAGMARLDDFLAEWAEALKDHRSNRARILLLEAVGFLDGTEGVAKLARVWGKTQPRGYLYWIQILLRENDWRAASEVCKEALEVLPPGLFRKQAAGYLATAGGALEDPGMVLDGKRWKLLSAPTDADLLDFVEEADGQAVRQAELKAALAVYKTHAPVSEPGADAVHMNLLLMAGEIKSAFDEGKEHEIREWSGGGAGILLGSVLHVVSGTSDSATAIKALLERYTTRKRGFSWMAGPLPAPSTLDQILKGLDRCEVDPATAAEFWTWAEKVGREGIDRIVSQKRRNAYDQAASILGALTECLILLGRREEGQRLVEIFYFEKYNRFSAFRREVKSVFQRSEPLRRIRL